VEAGLRVVGKQIGFKNNEQVIQLGGLICFSLF